MAADAEIATGILVDRPARKHAHASTMVYGIHTGTSLPLVDDAALLRRAADRIRISRETLARTATSNFSDDFPSILENEMMMSAYTIVATGPVFAYPKEQSAISATEAEAHCLALRRLCGRQGKVQVFGVRGREISWATLGRLAEAERTQPTA